MTDELKKSLWISYWIISILLIIPILIANYDTQKSIYNIIPKCPSQKNGKTCVLCHSSTTYYYLAQHNTPVNTPINTIAIAIFYGSIANFGIVIIYFLYWVYEDRINRYT